MQIHKIIRVLCIGFAAAVLSFLSACKSDNQPKVEPVRNVLLITLDTTRADHLGCYGYAKPTSPILDALAKDSVLFENAIAQAAVTPVSHASILTGLQPYHHGLRVLHGHVGNRLDEQHATFAEMFKEAGGDTVAFISAFPVAAVFGLEQGFDHFDADFPGADGKDLVDDEGRVNTGRSQRRADVTTDAVIKWLGGRASTDKPLFLWVHYFDPHDPVVRPPKEVMDQFPRAGPTHGDLARAIYDADICYMDAQIGRLLDEFKKRGLQDKTVIAVVADHGEGLGDHDWWTHGILYQEQIHVPMMVHDPAVKGGKRVPSMVQTVDLVPTLLELANVPKAKWPAEMDGKSLTQAMKTGKLDEPRMAYSDSVNMIEYSRYDSLPKKDDPTPPRKDRKNDKYYALLDGRYKLIFHQLMPENTEFYDLAADPKELKNLAKSNPPEMQKLMKELEALDPLSSIVPGMKPGDDARVQALEGLGYLSGSSVTTKPTTTSAPAK